MSRVNGVHEWTWLGRDCVRVFAAACLYRKAVVGCVAERTRARELGASRARRGTGGTGTRALRQPTARALPRTPRSAPPYGFLLTICNYTIYSSNTLPHVNVNNTSHSHALVYYIVKRTELSFQWQETVADYLLNSGEKSHILAPRNCT